jgi:hypothetical protein
MVNQSTEPKRRRPRFGLRTLLLIPLLVAVYFALGSPTRTAGVRDVGDRLTRENSGTTVVATYKAPLLIEFPVMHIQRTAGGSDQLVTKSDYYVWFFGWSAKLPYSGETSRDIPVVAMQ